MQCGSIKTLLTAGLPAPPERHCHPRSDAPFLSLHVTASPAPEYPGLHDAIIDPATWDTVQRLLAGNAVDRSCPTNTPASFLLTGLVFDETGAPLYQSQAHKKGKRYRYYISGKLMHDAHRSDDGWRLPAASLEVAVVTPIRNLLQDRPRLMDMLDLEHHSPAVLNALNTRSHDLINQLTDGTPGIRRDILQEIIQRIALSPETITLTLNRKALTALLQVGEATYTQGRGDTTTITVPFTLRRHGVEKKLVIEGPDKEQNQPDLGLCRQIAQARFWFDQLASGEATSVRAISKRYSANESEVTRILPLAFLAPEMVEAILNGHHPEGLSVENLRRSSPLPTDWKAQGMWLLNLN